MSYDGVLEEDKAIINPIVKEVKEKHGCQIIVNGVKDTLKYYMRLIDNLEEFYQLYSDLISTDSELKSIHKQKWNEL